MPADGTLVARTKASGRKNGCSAVDYLRDFSSLALRATTMRPATVTAGACNVPNERDVQVRRGKWQRWWGKQRSGRGFRSQARKKTRADVCGR